VWISFSIGGEPAPECVVLELWADRLPKTSENFRQLIRGDQGVHPLTRTPMHSKGSPIHRIVPGLCIQGGDFVCRDGSGGESIYGASFADEGFVTMHTEPGLLCMANAGPDTNRSQFCITTAAAPQLDGHHVIFGKVLSGMATVEAIAALPVDDRERPARGREVIIHDCGEVTNIL
jgi:peptidyl-prolyl isomerase G (cyclophilin G)